MIDILLATYNGEKYIYEQLESIMSQTFQDFRIVIRDDGSTDLTVSILEEYASKFPQKIQIVKDNIKCGSAVSNFFELTKYATAEYVMYADQDDVWLPNKIEITLNKMHNLEEKYGNDKPILVFSSYKVVGSELEDIKFNESKGQIASYNLELNRLLVQNYVTGCLIMANRSLYTNMGQYDKRILMHDWWLALYASANGIISHIEEITMLYRQHGNNCAGAVEVTSMKYRISKMLDSNSKNMKYQYKKQAECFLERYGYKINSSQKKVLDDFIKMYNARSKIKRIRALIKGKYFKSDWARIMGQIWYI